MPNRDDADRDKLFKVRLLIESLVHKCKNIPLQGQMFCVDEQIVPFKGHSTLKTYNPKKPHKWGYKIFALCDMNGMIYNFDIYQGKIKPKPDHSTFSSDYQMKRRGRGCYEEKQAMIEGVEIRAIKWFDNKGVTLATTFFSAEPLTSVERWDRVQKKKLLFQNLKPLIYIIGYGRCRPLGWSSSIL
nr:unnamed protein product [Callosobruchus analis]